MRAMSLSIGETEGEVNDVRCLSVKLDLLKSLVDNLISQLTELKDAVSFMYNMVVVFVIFIHFYTF